MNVSSGEDSALTEFTRFFTQYMLYLGLCSHSRRSGFYDGPSIKFFVIQTSNWLKKCSFAHWSMTWNIIYNPHQTTYGCQKRLTLIKNRPQFLTSTFRMKLIKFCNIWCYCIVISTKNIQNTKLPCFWCHVWTTDDFHRTCKQHIYDANLIICHMYNSSPFLRVSVYWMET